MLLSTKQKTHNLHANKNLLRSFRSMESFLDMEKANATTYKSAFFLQTESNADTQTVKPGSRRTMGKTIRLIN